MTHLTIFDCDGTLVDSERLANEVLVEILAECGHVLSLEEAVAAFRGVKMQRCVELLEARFATTLEDTFVATFRARMEDAFRDRLRPVEGALELVSSMDGPIAVASSGPRRKLELSLSLTGLLPYFEGRVFSSYEVGSWKPDPGLYLHVAGALGVDPSDCTVVEDSLPGVRAAIAAGIRVVAFQPHGAHPDLPSGVRVIERLAELLSPQSARPVVPEQCRGFWEAFVASTDQDVTARFGGAFHFCDTPELADPLAELVLARTKRATTGLLWSYEAEGEAIPEVGGLFIVTTFAGDPVCVIENTAVRVVPYEDVDDAYAEREGEGDRSLRYWREAHWTFFSRECAALGREPAMSMPVVCEEFEVVYPL